MQFSPMISIFELPCFNFTFINIYIYVMTSSIEPCDISIDFCGTLCVASWFYISPKYFTLALKKELIKCSQMQHEWTNWYTN